MNRITLVFLSTILFLSCSLNAQRYSQKAGKGPSSLSIVSQTKHLFWLFVDEVPQNEQPVKSICVKGMAQGDHYVRVELDNTNHNTVGQIITIGKNTMNYCITQKSGFFGLSAFNMDVYPELTVSYDDNQPLPNHNVRPMNAEMSHHDFEIALQTLEKQSYDNTKLTVAKQIASDNLLNVNQIKQICSLFSFENNKLEFAKFAYNSCVDKNNYFKINDVFKFDADKQQLNSFIYNQ